MAFLRKLAADSTGTSAVEYAIICSLIVIGLVVSVQGLGASVVNSFTTAQTSLQTANAA
jgi:Flp pilus assembly pilin Flp